MRDPRTMREAVHHCVSELGGLHLAVNNAGITGPQATWIEDLSLEDWEAVIGTDLTGMFLSLKAELPAIVRSGGGAVVNLSSANGVACIAAYTSSTPAAVCPPERTQPFKPNHGSPVGREAGL